MESAEERRERLKRLREEATTNEDDGAGPSKDQSAVSKSGKEQQIPTISFRNYKPRDQSIASKTVPAAKPRALDAPKPTGRLDGADKQSAIDSYAPKKPHLDLKKDVAKSLRKLERATQRAIDELYLELQLQEGQAIAGEDAAAG